VAGAGAAKAGRATARAERMEVVFILMVVLFVVWKQKRLKQAFKKIVGCGEKECSEVMLELIMREDGKI